MGRCPLTPGVSLSFCNLPVSLAAHVPPRTLTSSRERGLGKRLKVAGVPAEHWHCDRPRPVRPGRGVDGPAPSRPRRTALPDAERHPRHRTHSRDQRRNVLHRFEAPGPQQDFLVELGRLVLGGDPVHLPGCRREPRAAGQRAGTQPGSPPARSPLPPRPSRPSLTRTRGPRAAGGPAARESGESLGPEKRDRLSGGFSRGPRGAAEDAPGTEAQEAPGGREHRAPCSPPAAAGLA